MFPQIGKGQSAQHTLETEANSPGKRTRHCMQLSCCYSLVCVFTSRRVQVYPGFPAEQSRWLPKTNTQHRTPRKYRVHLFACSNLVPCHNQAIEMCQKEARSASNKASHVRYMYLHVCIFRYLYINKINKHIYIYIHR